MKFMKGEKEGVYRYKVIEVQDKGVQRNFPYTPIPLFHLNFSIFLDYKFTKVIPTVQG